MFLCATIYKITGDNQTYLVLDATPQEQSETKHRILGTAVLDWLYTGEIPIQIKESHGPSSPPIPFLNNVQAIIA